MPVHEVYDYETTDPKQKHNELGVTIYFDKSINKDEAITQTSLLLDGIGAEYTFDIWSMPQKEEQ
tara:strand:- start:1126 stop:1320 length:195 start_codon:yes stop_codon:yes gene_type:complete